MIFDKGDGVNRISSDKADVIQLRHIKAARIVTHSGKGEAKAEVEGAGTAIDAGTPHPPVQCVWVT
jgi:hypothetical protein